jgi:hypothetical protein
MPAEKGPTEVNTQLCYIEVVCLEVVLQLPHTYDKTGRHISAQPELFDQRDQILEVLPPMLLTEAAEARLGTLQAKAALS